MADLYSGCSRPDSEGEYRVNCSDQGEYASYKNILREKAGKIYSQDLLNNLFRYPYTKIEYIMHDLNVSRNTAIRYLDTLQELKLVEKTKIGRDNFYLNKSLTKLLLNPK